MAINNFHKTGVSIILLMREIKRPQTDSRENLNLQAERLGFG